jgi:hypothetical protein
MVAKHLKHEVLAIEWANKLSTDTYPLLIDLLFFHSLVYSNDALCLTISSPQGLINTHTPAVQHKLHVKTKKEAFRKNHRGSRGGQTKGPRKTK